MGKVVYYSTMKSPIGPLTLAKTNKGLCCIEFGEEKKALLSLQIWCNRFLDIDEMKCSDEYLKEEQKQLQEYFAGQRTTFDLQLDINGTSFQKMVWSQLLLIPYGETKSYKEIALSIKAPQAVRAIGGANHKNPIPIIVPCHRVIGSNGALVGYGGGLSIKEFLLDFERNQKISSAQ